MCFFFSERCFKYLSHDDWVTSGKVGSREAVLVFRTNILNPKTRKTLLETPPDQRELKTADSQVTLSTPSELIHKCSSSPAISNTQQNYSSKGKIFVAVEKSLKCKEINNFDRRNPMKKP